MTDDQEEQQAWDDDAEETEELDFQLDDEEDETDD